jgi:hypothetical protein
MSLPAKDKEAILAKIRLRHPKAICWTCGEHDLQYLPAPCKNRKRFQSEGFCTSMSIKGVAT